MADKFINDVGLVAIKNWIEGKFALDSDLDALAEEVQEIIAEGGEPNTIETISVNGTNVPPDGNKNVALTVPTATSDLTNDGDGTSNFATEDYVDENGGKIDSISIDGTTQTIDANKNVALDLSDYAKGEDIPTATSDLTNDSGFQTSSDVSTAISTALANGNDPYQTESDVESAIASQVGSAYKAKGSVTFANLPALSATNEGSVYNVTDAFTTTADFVEGAGHSYPAGTNVVIINNGTEQSPSYKYDVLTGVTDLSAYWISTAGQSNTLEAMTVAEINAILNPSS